MARRWLLAGAALVLAIPAWAQNANQQHGPFDTAQSADAAQSASPVPVKGNITTTPAPNSPGTGSATPSYTAPASGSYGNNGGALTTANTAQTGIPAGAMAHGGDLVNNSNPATTNNEVLCFSVGGTAVLGPGNPCLSPGSAYHFTFPPPSGQAVSVIAATAGHTWTWIAY